MNYYKSGLYNRKLEQAYLYDKKKKELKDGRNKGNDTEERSRKKTENEKATTEFQCFHKPTFRC